MGECLDCLGRYWLLKEKSLPQIRTETRIYYELLQLCMSTYKLLQQFSADARSHYNGKHIRNTNSLVTPDGYLVGGDVLWAKIRFNPKCL